MTPPSNDAAFGLHPKDKPSLAKLLGPDAQWPLGPAPVEPFIGGLSDDSRAVQTGDLFIARRPSFAADAAQRGAAAIVAPVDQIGPVQDALRALGPGFSGFPLALVPAVDQAFAGQLAEAFHGQPAKALRFLAITGTNGKTTTAFIAQHLVRHLIGPCGLIGTVHNDTNAADGPRQAALTTPGALQLSGLLLEMASNGCQVCVLEASSHALDQGRMAHLPVASAVFTNLTQDHLDYHETMERYAEAKRRLFDGLDKQATAVVNGDDPWGPRMLENCPATALFTSLKPDAVGDPTRCVATDLQLFADRTEATFLGPWGAAKIQLPMVGKHNVSNALQAAAAVYGLKPFTAAELETALATAPPVPGRLEPVTPAPGSPGSGTPGNEADASINAVTHSGASGGPVVLVDYAHTPDAVERVLSTVRPITPGRLVAVLGCGGDRDKTKRPLMAQAAFRLADHAVLTSDNPRTEDPQAILDDMLAGLSEAEQQKVTVSIDRAVAIAQSIAQAKPGDTVVIAGKGHEDYQILGTEKIHFDDREHAREALSKWGR